MDYEFRRDVVGKVIATFSTGHEALGHWFTDEVQDRLALLDEIAQKASELKASKQEYRWTGHEYTLILEDGTILIRANSLDFSLDELEEGMSFYDAESHALCGVEDFLAAAEAYRRFYLHNA